MSELSKFLPRRLVGFEYWLATLLVLTSIAAGQESSQISGDWRLRTNGLIIPGESYCDQPYLVRTDDGAWLCCLTTAQGREGSPTQNVVTMRSADQGANWSPPQPMETPGGPEASYGVLLKVPSGRIYCFYNFNRDNLREVKTETGGTLRRVDSLGDYVFRFSDDHGLTWSKQRYSVPVREFACDRENVYGGKVRFFWNVGRPLTVDEGAAKRPRWPGGPGVILTLHKVGAMGAGFFSQSEGAFLRSNNILTEADPAKLQFETLPAGEIGLRAPEGGGRIAEEQSLVQLTDGSLFCVYRTVAGHPAYSISRDGAQTWTPPDYLRYSPAGRKFKHPRAANFLWALGEGRYLYWFHNHGPTPADLEAGWDPYADRNPVWVSAGRELDTPAGKTIAWSEPEILLYDDDPFVRMSYPDLIREGEQWYVTETQKSEGRIHAIEPDFLKLLLQQHENQTVTREGLILEVPTNGEPLRQRIPAPRWPTFVARDTAHEDGRGKDLRAGLTLDVQIAPWEKSATPTELIDSFDAQGRGLRLTAEPNGALTLNMSDGRTVARWTTTAGKLRGDASTHVVAIVDGGPKLLLFVIAGELCDGGEEQQFGWGRYSPHFRGPAGNAPLKLNPAVEHLRIYQRALRVSEAVGNSSPE